MRGRQGVGNWQRNAENLGEEHPAARKAVGGSLPHREPGDWCSAVDFG
jgi:hypothetical protein